MSNKQDGYSSRTAADLERKYNFGKTFAEVYGLVSDAQRAAEEAQKYIDELDQEEIFNLLTNFGQAQGIYRDDAGDVYINASYIKSGKLAAEYIDAESLKVAAANITGELVATQIDTKDLKVLAANITGTLTAGQIDATNLKVSAANITGVLTASQIDLTGAISFGDLTDSVSVQSQINTANSNASAALSNASAANANASAAANAVSAWTYTGSTYIDGRMIATGTVRASTLEGGQVNLLTAYNSIAGWLKMEGASSANFAISLQSGGALRMLADYGDIYIRNGGNQFVQLGGGYSRVIIGGGNLAPSYSGSFSCGASGAVWSDVYAANATIQTSDLNVKKDVVYGLDSYDALFDALRPISFRFIDGNSGRIHLGMGAQDVEQALADTGLNSMEFAGLIKSPKLDKEGEVIENEYDYALRYGEFIPLLIEQVQKLKQRVNALEGLT